MKGITKLDFNGLQYTVWNEEIKKIPKDNLKTLIKYDKSNKRKNLSKKTRENNIQFLIILAKKFQKPYKQITRKDLIDYIDALDVSNGTK